MNVKTVIQNIEYQQNFSATDYMTVDLKMRLVSGASDLKKLLDLVKAGEPVMITDCVENPDYVEGSVKEPKVPKDFLTELRDQVSRFNLT